MALRFSDYDQRNYPVLAAAEGYAGWAKRYDELASGDSLNMPLLERVATVDWAASECAADLACGTGRVGAWLEDRGVGCIDGVDFTPEMIAYAARKNIYRELLTEDMRSTSLDDAGYDLVVNALSNEHVPDVVPLYREAARILRKDAPFVIVAYHPHFMLRGIPTHYRDDNGDNHTIETYIHLVSDHVAAARAAGLWLHEMHELIVDDEWVARMPKWERHLGRPVSMVFVWRRAAETC